MVLNQIVNMVIRPPRAAYNVEKHLLGPLVSIRGVQCRRHDFQLANCRDLILQCSHYRPQTLTDPSSSPLPCVIFCHTSSGCRADANVAVRLLIPLNIEVLAVDFSGSGMSQGKYVTLGLHEVDDLAAAVKYLRSEQPSKKIGLWGTSMGAVVGLMYGAKDPSIQAVVADSPFCSLTTLVVELVDFFRIPVPKFLVKLMLIPMMRRRIRKKAGVDIYTLNLLESAPCSKVPVLLAHARGDKFVNPHHSSDIYRLYAGDKKRVTFEGDHGTPRPKAFFEKVSKFFCEKLTPPPVVHDDMTIKMQRVQSWTATKQAESSKKKASSSAASAVPEDPQEGAAMTRHVTVGAAQDLDRDAAEVPREWKQGANAQDPHFEAIERIAGEVSQIIEEREQALSMQEQRYPGALPGASSSSTSTSRRLEGHPEESSEDDDRLSDLSGMQESDNSTSRPQTPAPEKGAAKVNIEKFKKILMDR